MESHAVTFAEVARRVADEARSMGLATPVFKSPPRIVGTRRTIRRRADGRAVVAVSFRARPWPAVIGDLIEGIVVVNDLTGPAAARARDDLWAPFAASVRIAA